MITAIELFQGFQRLVPAFAGNATEGILIKRAEMFINLGITDYCLDALAGSQEIQPLKLEKLKQALGTATKMIPYVNMMRGTNANGALPIMDRDYQHNSGTQTDKYATLVGLPAEVLYAVSGSLDIQLGDEKVRTMVEVMPIDLQYYFLNRDNTDFQPNPHHCWSYENNAVSPSINGSTDPSVSGITGENVNGDPITFNYVVHQLLCPAGYVPVEYTAFYYKKPQPIVIDKQFQFHVDSDLPNSLKGDILARARKFYVESLSSTNVQAYPVTDAATKD